MSMSRRQGIGLVAGVVVAGLFAVGTAVAVAAPWPVIDREPLVVNAVPEPEVAIVSCPGPVLALGRDAANASGLTDAAVPQLTVSTAAGRAEATAQRLAAPDTIEGAGPTAFSAAPEQRTRTDVAAAGSARLADEDLSGFAAASCTPPLMESWLVGGSGLTGAADLVLLSNPGAVAARVRLTVYGALGPQTPAAGSDILVPAGTQRVVPMASIALGEGSPVIQVTAAEAPVQASLQTSITRTLLPTGLDQVAATAAPAEVQVIPAVTVTREPGDAGASNTTTILRLLAPMADTEATVDISRVGGPIIDTRTVPLTAGTPLELDLDGLPVGSYSVRIAAGAQIVAGLWETTGFGQGDDFAWHPAADAIGVPTLFSVARGPSPVLTVTNDAETDTTVQVVAAAGEGDAVDVTVPAGGSARYALRAGAVYQLVPGEDEVRASVTFAAADELAGYPITPADAAAAAVDVYVQ